MKRVYYKAENLSTPDHPHYLGIAVPESNSDKANLISSLVADDFNEGREKYEKRHALVLDLDFPCELIPSTTPGHFHLFIDKKITWLQALPILTAMAAAGLLEPGYVAACVAQGTTFVRKPGVPKLKVFPSEIPDR